MTRMRYVKMDRIMNHMLIHALREVFRQEKELLQKSFSM